MTLAGLALFIGVYAAAVASPGPGVAAVVARGLGRGLAGMPAFIAGFVVGDLVWFLAAALGLAAIAEAYAPLLTAIKYAGAAYLLYLAWKLWTAPTTSAASPEGCRRAETTIRPPSGVNLIAFESKLVSTCCTLA